MKSPLLPRTLIAMLLAGGHALAGTTVVDPSPAGPTMTTTSGDWEFTLGLYGWGAGLDGDLGFAGNNVPVDISFSDIADTLEMTFMGMFEVRKGPWMFQFEGFYLRNGVDTYSNLAGGPGTLQTTLTAETTRLEPVIGYRLIDNECTRLDLVAGAVYHDITNELRFIGPIAQRNVKSSEEWFDPVVGVRFSRRLSDRWNIQLRGDIGGFGVNSDFLWQAFATFNYEVTDAANLFIGYRHTSVDYQSGGFLYDVDSGGPLVGLTYTW